MSQARWSGKPENAHYHRGPEQVERNRAWRRAHPAYRAQQRVRQRQRRHLREVLSPELSATLISCGLQDLNDRQLALMLGLVGRVCGDGLQDQMAATLRRIMFDGYKVLRGPEPI